MGDDRIIWVMTGYSIAYVDTWGSSPTPLIASHIYYVQVRIILQVVIEKW